MNSGIYRLQRQRREKERKRRLKISQRQNKKMILRKGRDQ